MFTADYLLGRTFTMPIYIGNTIGGFLDITVVAFDPQQKRIRVHGEDGSKAYWSLSEFRALLLEGDLQESEAAPSVKE